MDDHQTKQTAGTAESLVIGTAEECARFSLRVGAEGRARAGTAFGGELPALIGGMTAVAGRLALCLGPDEWQLLAPASEAPGIEQRFAALYAELPLSLVDIGHRETGIEIRGTAATLALNSACALDLDKMPSGAATRTIFDRAQIILIKHTPEHYRIEIWRSFAGHVWTLLDAVKREVAQGI